MYNQFKILILLALLCIVNSHQESNLTFSKPKSQVLNYLKDELNNYDILPIIICLYFIYINV